MTDVDYYRQLLQSVYGARRWILALDVLASGSALAKELTGLGADAVFCVAASRGTGEFPEPALYPQRVLGIEANDMMGGIRQGQEALARRPRRRRKGDTGSWAAG